MPIKRRNDRRRLSRVGKIHLGVKSDKGVPRAVDYFVVKPDASTSEEADAAFKAVYGDEPRELSIMFPTDDPQQWADQWYKLYSQSFGLVCRGDGESAWARWDADNDGPRPAGIESGTWANHRTQGWTSREIPCAGPQCPMQAEQGLCRQVMNLQFLLPDVRGIGVWQIDSGSINSILNIEDSVETIKAVTGGRIRGLLLKLRMSQKEVVPPGGKVKKKKVWVLDLTLPDVALADLLAQTAALPVGGAIMLPPPSEEDQADVFDPVQLIEEYEEQVSGPPFGVTAAEAGAAIAVAIESVTVSVADVIGSPAEPPDHDAARVAFLNRKPENVGDLLTWAFAEFHLKPPQVDEILKCEATKLQANEWQRAWVTVVNHVLGAQVPFA